MGLFGQLFRLFKHSLIYALGTVASQVVAFVFFPIYTRYLSPYDYGVLEIFHATMSVLVIILIMGLATALFRSYFDYDEEERRREVISTALLFLTGTSLFFCLLLTGMAENISLFFFDSIQYTPYFRVIFLTLFFDTGVIIALAVFRAKEESKKYGLFSFIRFLMTGSLQIFFIVVLHRGLLGILEGGLIAAFLLYIFLVGGIVKEIKLRFSLAELKKMLSFGLPLVPALLGSWILTLADRYFLQFLSTSHELGLYSLGYKFGLFINILITQPFNMAWLPFLFSIARGKNAREIHSRVLTYLVLIGVFVTLGLSVLSKEILKIIATPPFYESYKVIPLIALSYVLYTCYFVFYGGIHLERKTKFLPLIVGASATMNLGLNYLLIPSYGMMGAAIATFVSYLLLPISAFVLSRTYYPVQYEWAKVAKILVAAATVYVGSISIINDSAAIAVVLKLLSLLGFPILLFFFRFFKPEEIQKAKELFRIGPGFIRLRLVNSGLLRRKQN